MSAADDRTVHGRTVEGYLIVRYDRSGKWYIEPLNSEDPKRERVTVDNAADNAASGTHYPGRTGGTRFDALVNRYLNLGEEP